MPADRLPAALADLDPGNRALLDLSLRRGVSDAEIGELLRKDPDDVARGRDAVLGLLADSLGVEGDDRRERVRRAVSALPDEAWRAAPEPTPEPERTEETAPPVQPDVNEGTVPPVTREHSPAAFGAPPRETERPRPAVSKPEPPKRPREEAPFAKPPAQRPRSARRWLVPLGVLAILLALGVLLLGGGDDDGGDGGDTRPADRQDSPTPPRADAGKRVALQPFGGGDGSGRIEARGDGSFVITLQALPRPDGTYQAWLYNDIVDAIPLGTFREGSGRLQIRLPARARRYRFVDVSQEPADSNRNHSGDSVLRGRLGELVE